MLCCVLPAPRMAAVTTALLTLLAGGSRAQGVQWQQSPINGHWYALLPNTDWNTGEGVACQYGGHLVTIRSQVEQDWVYNTFFGYSAMPTLWIGFSGYYSGIPPACCWTSGESVTYTNWGGGAGTGVSYARIEYPGWWLLNTATWSYNAGSVLEITSGDCDANGLPDVAEIHDNPQLDLDSDGVLNACEDCDGNGTVDGLDIQAGTSLDYDSNGMPDQCQLAGMPYCFGDSTGHTCPCDPGQIGSPGHGCANSTLEGAILSATGVARVSGDDLQLHVRNMRNPTTVVFMQGTLQQSGGQGAFSGDGLLCVNGSGGNLIRLGMHGNQPGSSDFGYGIGTDPLISVRGLIPAIGATRYYQAYYRDNVAYCTTAKYNFSNGLTIVWAP